jgi:hypothetical protein
VVFGGVECVGGSIEAGAFTWIKRLAHALGILQAGAGIADVGKLSIQPFQKVAKRAFVLHQRYSCDSHLSLLSRISVIHA